VTYLTHLSHDYDHFQTESTLPDNIRLAYDGLRIEIGLNSAEIHSQYPS
jgi:phosphoribosyl 1,2-cyclic phosphate phosphodiesterase